MQQRRHSLIHFTGRRLVIAGIPLVLGLALIIIGTADVLQGQGGRRFPLSHLNGKLFDKDGKPMLYGGENDTWHFDLSVFRLNPKQLCHGLGREGFHALIEPKFESVRLANSWMEDTDRVLTLSIDGESRIYSVDLLIRHEVVNDVVAGKPVFAAYCILADLGAVYDRVIQGREFTFALSGYTYFDKKIWDGLNSFVMWDRETESLWLPAMGTAVSGLMVDTPLQVLDTAIWAQTTWAAAKAQYPDAQVLRPGQRMQPPINWRRYTAEDLASDPAEDRAQPDVAPHWGGNPLP